MICTISVGALTMPGGFPSWSLMFDEGERKEREEKLSLGLRETEGHEGQWRTLRALSEAFANLRYIMVG